MMIDLVTSASRSSVSVPGRAADRRMSVSEC